MGSCYSCKASGGTYTYTTVQMASTKLEETSRLARPTPYSRNVSANTTSNFCIKKSIPPPTKFDHVSPVVYNASHTSELEECKNQKPAANSCVAVSSMAASFQSNIPRMSSNIPSTSSVILSDDNIETNEAILDSNYNKYENELHIMNNNTESTDDVTDVLQNSASNKHHQMKRSTIDSKGNIVLPNKCEKINVGSKSYPDGISNQQGKADEKNLLSRIPAKFTTHLTGLPRPQLPHYVGKSTLPVSQINKVSQSAIKMQSLSCDKLSTGKEQSLKSSDTDSDLQKEHSQIANIPTGDSHDSIADMDSGLGNSLIEKSKQEDADTLKDVEHFDSCEDSPVFQSQVGNENNSVPEIAQSIKNLKLEKISLRSPTYKKEPNGKWKIHDKNFGLIHKYNIKTGSNKDSKTDLQQSSNYLGDKNTYKNSAYENGYSTYASYRGLLSYKRLSPLRQFDSTILSRGNEKYAGSEKVSHSEFSSIPKFRKQRNSEGNKHVNLFSVTEYSGTGKAEKGFHNVRMSRKTSYKMELPMEQKQSSPESEDKSDSIGNGIISPVSEIENREFLIDDEISDQPALISFENSKISGSSVPSLQQTMTELHALQAASCLKKRTDSQGSFNSKLSRERSATEGRESLVLCSDIGSSCSSLGSDDLMLDYEKTFDHFPEGTINEGPASPVKKIPDLDSIGEKLLSLRREKRYSADYEDKTRRWAHRRASGSFAGEEWRLRSVSLPLRPPRQMSVLEAEDGSIKLDSSSYRLLCQDLNNVKTLLLRLKTVIQEAETLNPFDQANPKNIFFHSLVHSDFPPGSILFSEEKQAGSETSNVLLLTQENADLKRQLVLLQQQLDEKDHTIHLLQQQMTKYTNFLEIRGESSDTINAATQTERIKTVTSSSHSSSADDSSETLVSVQDAFEDHFSKSLKEQDSFRDQMEEVTRSLSSLNQSLRVTANKYPYLQNRSASSSELWCYRHNS